MKPIIDTTKYRASIRKLGAEASKTPAGKTYEKGQGVEVVPADDRELLGEGIHPPFTVRYWAGSMYQKLPDAKGTWAKLTSAEAPKHGKLPEKSDSWKE